MRDELRDDPALFETLDAAQLVKHAFGLLTDARRKSKKAHLQYLYAEPAIRAVRPIPDDLLQTHRQETRKFAAAVAGAEVSFWLSTWTGLGLAVHAQRLLEAFAP